MKRLFFKRMLGIWTSSQKNGVCRLNIKSTRCFKYNLSGIIFLLLIPFFGYTQKDNKKCFKLPEVLKEVSGLYIEGPDKWWWHNDSGGQPALIQTNRKGDYVKEIVLESIKNKDWEDITSDDQGNIYIGDFGNNRNQRKDLKIYVYHPETKAIDSISFVYPDQVAFPPAQKDWNFNMEGFFWFQDSLHLFSKNLVQKGNHYTKHYKIPAQSGSYVATLVDSIYLKNRVITGAAISPDKKTVALIGYTYKKVFGLLPWSAASIYFIRDFSGSRFLKGNIYKKKAPSFIVAMQYESIDFWDHQTIYIASEKTKFIKQKAKRIRIKPRFFKERKRVENELMNK